MEKERIKDQWSSDWLTVEQLITFDRSVMNYKMMNKICPESLWDANKTREVCSNYRTRNCTYTQLPRYYLEYSRKAFIAQVLKLGMKSQLLSENSQTKRFKDTQ